MPVAPLTPGELVGEKYAPMGAALTAVQADFVDDFAYGYFDNNTAVVGFANRAPEGAKQLLTQTALPYKVQENVGFLYADYVAQTEILAAELISEAEKFRPSEMSIMVAPRPELGPGHIVVTISGADQNGVTSAENLVSQMRSSAPFTVELERRDQPIEQRQYNRAGGMWMLNTAGQGTCTSAFVTKSLYGPDLGLLTAGHCPNSLRYYNEAMNDVLNLTFVQELPAAFGDAQLHRTPVMMDAWFVAAPGAGRPVQEVRAPWPGETQVCFFGKRTAAQRCGNLIAHDVTIATLNGVVTTNYSHQAVIPVVSDFGDSGGPVFRGNTAMGVLSSGDEFVTSFSMISYVQLGLGVKVCRDPVCA